MAKIFVCGDIVNERPKIDFIGKRLSDVIKSADYAVCNLEGPEIKQGRNCSFPHQEEGTIDYLVNVGFNLFLLSNNHITEDGKDGLRNSIDKIKINSADNVGAGLSLEEAYKPLTKTICDKKYAFVNVCEAQVGQYLEHNQNYGYAWMGYDNLYEDVKNLSVTHDFVIVFVHAGLEHYDIPLPEIRTMYKKLCDVGASVVIGGHPHCAQGFEYYKDKLIIYSLGNFWFPLRKRWPNEAHSYSVFLDFRDNGVVSIEPIFHFNDGNEVETESDHIGLEELNKKLDKKKYFQYIEDVISKAYNNLCQNLIQEATCGQRVSERWKTIIRHTLNYTVFRKRCVINTEVRRNKLLLRLFENETYRWVIIRYLKSKTK